jgi:hypothetical protein
MKPPKSSPQQMALALLCCRMACGLGRLGDWAESHSAGSFIAAAWVTFLRGLRRNSHHFNPPSLNFKPSIGSELRPIVFVWLHPFTDNWTIQRQTWEHSVSHSSQLYISLLPSTLVPASTHSTLSDLAQSSSKPVILPSRNNLINCSHHLGTIDPPTRWTPNQRSTTSSS